MPFDFYSEFDSPATVNAIRDGLLASGHRVHMVEADGQHVSWLLTHAVDLVFNIAEGTGGAHRESQAPAILEVLQIPFTGSGSFVLALTLDKAKSKQILAAEGLPTPAWQLFRTGAEPLDPRLQFPLIVKPNREGSGKGISRESVVRDEPALRRQVAWILEHYRQDVLVEEFIDGGELTVGVLGNDLPQALPILEIDFSPCGKSGESFYSWRMKEFQGDEALGLTPGFYCPARLDAETADRVKAVAVRAHQALGCADVSRTDIRLRKDGTPFILEINPLPGFDPHESNLPMMAQAAGVPYPVLLHHLVELAWARQHQEEAAQAREPSLSQLVESRHAP